MEKECADFRASLPCISSPLPVVRDVLPSPYPHYPLTSPPRRRSNPCSLGLFAFAVTTLINGVQNLLWPLDSRNTMTGVALIYGGGVQFIVGFMEHSSGNNFSGATFASFGAMWLARGLCTIFSAGAGLYGAYNNQEQIRHSIAAIDGSFTLVAITLTLIAGIVLRNSSRLLTMTLGAVCVVGALGTISDCLDNDAARSVVCRLNGGAMLITAVLAWYGAVNELCLEEGIKLPVGAIARREAVASSPISLPPTIHDFSARTSKDIV